MCREHIAYLWILGGMTVNYHTLADFRESQGKFPHQLLSQSVASLMADGGFRPAYNVQMDVDTIAQLIVGMRVTNAGVDQGQMAPMIEQERERYGKAAKEHLVDGGFATHRDIQEAVTKGVVVYAPLPEIRPVTKPPHGPTEPLPPAVIAWRERMQTEEAKAICRQRASTVDWVNAVLCNRGLRQFTVRGLEKIQAVVLWFSLLHNMLIGHKLRQAPAPA